LNRRVLFSGAFLMNFAILPIFVFLMLTSCGKKETTSQTQISFFGGKQSLLQSGVQMNGGVIVTAYKYDKTQKYSFALNNASDEKTINLTKGYWEFVAIGWEGGNGNFTGANRCAYSGLVSLVNNETSVNLNLNYATCANIPNRGAIVSRLTFMEANNQFKALNVQSCETLSLGVLPSCSGAAGLMKSFKVVAHSSLGLPSIQSNCQTPLSANGFLSTPLRLPVGNFLNGKFEGVMEASVLTYTTTDCSDPVIPFRFYNSLFGGINQATMKAGVSNLASDTTLWIESNINTSVKNGEIFGSGLDNDLTLSADINQSSGDYGAVENIDTGGTPSLTVGVSQAANIANGDEIMWFVNYQSGTGCASGGLVPGMFGFARVNGTPNGGVIPLNHSILDYQPTGYPAVTLTKPSTFGTTCSIQLVRVPNYLNVTSSSVSMINVTAFNYTSGFGGLFPFRVKNEMAISGSGRITIAASGKGIAEKTITNCDNGILTGTNGFRCMIMGGNQNTPRTPVQGQDGGGIIMGAIKGINLTTTNSIPMMFLASAGSTAGSSASGDGGSSIVTTDEIKYNGVEPVPQISLGVNWTYGTGGSPNGKQGFLRFQWCSNNNYVKLPTGHTQGCAM
jgi:hypothetical protein